MKTNIIIQARLGSTRLPNKVLLDLCGEPVLKRVIERLSQSKKIDEIIVATTDLEGDDVLYENVCQWGIPCIRGDSGDVLARYYKATIAYPSDNIIRVTADCPLIDPGVCDDMIEFYEKNGYRYVSNAPPDWEKRTYPRGLDCEMFKFDLLEEANKSASEEYEREHVTPYMYWKNKSVGYYGHKGKSYSHLRWTLDTPEDYLLIKNIYQEIYSKNPLFSWLDVIKLYETYPEWAEINKEIEQKKTR